MLITLSLQYYETRASLVYLFRKILNPYLGLQTNYHDCFVYILSLFKAQRELVNKMKTQQIPFISFPMHDILFILKCGPLTSVLSIVLLNGTKHNVWWSDCQGEFLPAAFGKVTFCNNCLFCIIKQGGGRICVNCGGFIHKAWNEPIRRKSFLFPKFDLLR
jgi:hypothetical protein